MNCMYIYVSDVSSSMSVNTVNMYLSQTHHFTSNTHTHTHTHTHIALDTSDNNEVKWHTRQYKQLLPLEAPSLALSSLR